MDVKSIDRSEPDQHICFICLSIGPPVSGGAPHLQNLCIKMKNSKEKILELKKKKELIDFTETINLK